MSLLIADALLVLTGVFMGAGITAGVAGEAPIDFMGADPRRVAVGTTLGAIVSGFAWTVVFHPALLAIAGGFIGATAITGLAGATPIDFMNDPHPSRIGVVSIAFGVVTLVAWLAM